MKSHDTLEDVCRKQADFYVTESLSEEESGGNSGLDEAQSPDTAQTERAVMHPDRRDLEWRYCRGGWVG